MPYLIDNPCRVPGCPNPVKNREPYCTKHRPPYADAPSPPTLTYGKDSFYGHRRWRRARRAYLTAYPLCVYCEREGRVEVATVVDHIIPRRAGGADYDWDNLQGLCIACHGIKTREDERTYPYVKPSGEGGGPRS